MPTKGLVEKKKFGRRTRKKSDRRKIVGCLGVETGSINRL